MSSCTIIVIYHDKDEITSIEADQLEIRCDRGWTIDMSKGYRELNERMKFELTINATRGCTIGQDLNVRTMGNMFGGIEIPYK